MSAIQGSATDPQQPWGVLGTGTPTQFPLQDSPPAVVPSVGVQGVVSDSPDSISNFLQEFIDEPFLQEGSGAGVLGVRLAAPNQPGDFPVESLGFLAGLSPFAGEVTGVFGQGPQRGVIGIAGANGIGVFGGCFGGTGTGVFGEAGNNNVGVHGRSNGTAGVAVLGENADGGPAGRFLGDVDVTGKFSVNGQDVLATITQLQQTVAQIQQQLQAVGGRTNFGLLVAPPTSRPKLTVRPDSAVSVAITMSTGFIDHLHAIPRGGGGAFDVNVFGDRGFLGGGSEPAGVYTVMATDGKTADPNDSTNLLWSDPVDVTIPP